MDEYNEVRLEIGDDGVGTLIVDRQDKMNALDWRGMEAFHDAVRQVQSDKRVRCLVVTGAGDRAFISGGDLSDLKDYPEEKDGRRLADGMGAALDDLDRLDIPVVAAINGHSRGGGCEVAVACDIRVISENGTMGFVHVRQGISTAWGGAQRLKRLVGYGHAIELLLTGRIIGPEEALGLGLVEQVVPVGAAQAKAVEIAQAIAANPPGAVRALKRLVRLQANEAFEAEREMLARLWSTGDHLEAVAAFLEKRRPVFNFDAIES